MPIERRNPLPPARYWVNVPPASVAGFDQWLTANEAAGALSVDSTSSLSDGGNWVLFTVTSPVDWQGPGLPDIADPSVQSYADTITSPPVTDATDSLLSSAERVARYVGFGAFALLALYVYASASKK